MSLFKESFEHEEKASVELTDFVRTDVPGATETPTVVPHETRKQKLQAISTSIVFFNTW